MIPSVRTLERLFPTSDNSRRDALKLRRLLDGRDDPENYLTVQNWRRACFHWPPSRAEMVLCAANGLLGTHGVETIECEGDHGRYHHNIHASYCNTGDSYALTLLHETESGRYLVTSWGDYLERAERSQRECFSGS